MRFASLALGLSFIALASGKDPTCSCSELLSLDDLNKLQISDAPSVRGTRFCQADAKCYGPLKTTTASCSVKEGNPTKRCNLSVACFNNRDLSCSNKFLTIRFTKGKTTYTATETGALKVAVENAIGQKINPTSFVPNDRATFGNMGFFVEATVSTRSAVGSPTPKPTASGYSGRRLMEDETDLDLEVSEFDGVPPRRLLARRSPSKKPTSRKTSSTTKYYYLTVEIQGNWVGSKAGSTSMEDIKKLMTETAKKKMKCCSSVTFYKVCEGAACKSETCDEGPKCDSTAGTVVIIVIVVLVLCCCCVAAGVGIYFYMNQKNKNLNQNIETATSDETNDAAAGTMATQQPPAATAPPAQAAPMEAI